MSYLDYEELRNNIETKKNVFWKSPKFTPWPPNYRLEILEDLSLFELLDVGFKNIEYINFMFGVVFDFMFVIVHNFRFEE